MKSHPTRFRNNSLRLKTHDYTRSASYFITLCCHNREWRFGHVHKQKMNANEFGRIIEDTWTDIPDRHSSVELGDFQVMPDHFHAIIHIRTSTYKRRKNGSISKISLSEIIGEFKSISANKCLELHKRNSLHIEQIPYLGKIWQRNYYDCIIWDEQSLKCISRYIRNNPKKWLKK